MNTRSKAGNWARHAFAGLMLAGAGWAVHAASFPDYPLQTGAGVVPPNIMFILDNSGSMSDFRMPINGQNPIAPIDFSGRAVNKNSLAYDSNTAYFPWDTVDSSGNNTTVAGGQSYTAAYLDDNLATTPGTIGGNGRSVFYVLRDASAPDSSTAYDRYRIDAGGNLVKAAVTGSNVDLDSAPFSGTTTPNRWTTFSVSVPANVGDVVISTQDAGGQSGDADLYVTSDGSTPSTTNWACSSASSSAIESCDIEVVGAATINIGIRAYTNYQNIKVHVESARLGSESSATSPSGRGNAAEVQNIATWYSFNRTRIKAAKAGASRAFIAVGSGYRVGLDVLNQADGSARTSMLYPIPTGTNAGDFSGTNRKTWFDTLLAQTAQGYTPLRSTLKRTGDYYMTADPWADGSGTPEQSCRASFDMLTTDGYWNQDDGFTVGTGDVDGDGHSNTLADVAAYYWKTDLRPALADNVPTTTNDPANWQHMVTMSVSIGQQGTMPITNPPPASNSTSWTDPTVTEDATRIDDLWHAAVDGHGPPLVVAGQAAEFAAALRSALNQVAEQRASGSNITANGNSLNNGAQIFQAMYTTPAWSGDVLAYDISTGGIAATPDWSLAQTARAAAFKTVITTVQSSSGTRSAQAFDATIPSASAFARSGASGVTAADNIAYIKGEQKYEVQYKSALTSQTERAKAVLRNRSTPLGDIVNSSPFYQREVNMLFIGANDGMLHGVDSVTGNVRFSYVPAALSNVSSSITYAPLADLSNPGYRHQFFEDGQMDVSTVAQGGGKNILASGLGRGGVGLFALDVTSANLQDPTSGALTTPFSAANVLWDNTGNTDGGDMGYVLGQPLVRLGNNVDSTGAHVPLLITGNGIDSANGHAILYVYNASTGALIRKLDTGAGSATSPNGLSEPRAADIDGDGVADIVYAGDLQGNLWKFDLNDATPSKWGIGINTSNNRNSPSFTGTPFFVAMDASSRRQPITAAVALAREPITNRIFVNFGTGRLISNGTNGTQNDLVTTAAQPTQTVYGLIDDMSSSISDRSALTRRTIAYQGTVTVNGKTMQARSFETYTGPLPSSSRGWYVDLAPDSNTYARGERVITAPVVRGRSSWFSSIIPLLAGGCGNTGKGFLNAIDVFTGTNPQIGTFLDLTNSATGDGHVSVTGTPPTGNNGLVASLDLGVAMPGQPAQIGQQIAVGGSNAKTASVRKKGSSDVGTRLMWRELVNQQ